MTEPDRDPADSKAEGAPDITLPKETYGFPPEAFDWTRLPDVDTNFLPPEHVEAFIQALAAADNSVQNQEEPTPTTSYRLNSPLRRGSVTSFDAESSLRHLPSSLSLRSEYREPQDNSAATTTGTDVAGPRGSVAAPAAAAAPGDVAAPRLAQPPSVRNRQPSTGGQLIAARNDWAPINEKVVRNDDGTDKQKKKGKRRKKAARTKDETREGYLYSLVKWPFLILTSGWLLGLAVVYFFIRIYISLYEQLVTIRGERARLRREMRAATQYRDYVQAARRMDEYLGNGPWKEKDEFAYYNWVSVRKTLGEMRKYRHAAQSTRPEDAEAARKGLQELKALVKSCVRSNFFGAENPSLYSQTYYGTKNLAQNYIDELEKSLKFLIQTDNIPREEKRLIFKSVSTHYGRTALCLSGGATFSYYHFGVIKALLDENRLPDIITGTSGGALVAALVATRTNEELRQLLVPALAHRITACHEPISVWIRRWWKTGARFDSVDWARQCAWWTRGSMTFREAYERTGRILNVSCVPADPHSPTILCNYNTSPDCVIWSAVLASAAVPGILNPVVLLMKSDSGHLTPYSLGHKWKDGSLRTDIPIKALNMQFNVTFTIVSQVNPHINLFSFASRGSAGLPVTHRKGRGWRGGYLGSAVEQFLKLELNKWLRLLRQLELLPRPLGQDWSMLWLQTFGGTITIWPRSVPSDFPRILSDPSPARLARMIQEGRQSTFPKIKFIGNRLRIERLIEKGRERSSAPRDGGGGATGPAAGAAVDWSSSSSEDGEGGGGGGEVYRRAGASRRKGSIERIRSEDDLRRAWREEKAERRADGGGGGGGSSDRPDEDAVGTEDETTDLDEGSLAGGNRVVDGGDGRAELRAAGVEVASDSTPMLFSGAQGPL